MVSFSCHRCQDVVKKPKVVCHAASCGAEAFTCVDCMEVFTLHSVKSHTSCVSETDKYQGSWLNKQQNGNKRTQNKTRDNDGKKDSLGSARAQQVRQAMRELSRSDSDEDDSWIRQKKGTTVQRNATLAVQLTEDEKKVTEDDACHTEMDVRQHKRKRSDSCDSARIAETRSAHTNSNGESAVPSQQEQSREVDVTAVSTSTVRRCVSPFSLTPPPSVPCAVPSFVLGKADEIAEVVGCVLADKQVSEMKEKLLARELVLRYAVRIAKSVRQAINTAVESGVLNKCSSTGHISLVTH